MEQQKKEHKDIVMTCTSFYSIPLYYFTHLLCLVSTIWEMMSSSLVTSVQSCMLHIESKVLNKILNKNNKTKKTKPTAGVVLT